MKKYEKQEELYQYNVHNMRKMAAALG